MPRGIQAFQYAGVYAEPTANQTATGDTEYLTVGESVVFGDVCYLKSDGKWWKADADAATTMPALRMVLEAKSADQSCKMLISGRVRNDSWSWTLGSGTANQLFVSATAGAIVQNANKPTATGSQIQCVGEVTAATKIIFNPDSTVVTI